MLTPAFDLSQDAEYLNLNIRVPYTRTSEFDLYIDGVDFKFYAKPYFLRLTLPGRIVEDGREKATFDIDKGLFTVRVPKETPGEHFEGLQMLTSLLAPKGSRSAKPLVEDISADSSEGLRADVQDDEEEEEEEDFNWEVEQQVYTECSDEELRAQQKYGFGNQRCGVFARLQEELSDVIDVKNPEETTLAERRQARLEAESLSFSADHYLADLFEDDEIKGLLKFRPWWRNLSASTDQDEEAVVPFTEDEKEQLRKFTNRSYLLDKTSRHHAWLGLVDILLAYSYEVRSTEGEHNVESPWAIRKLSGTLCWLETYSSLQDVLVSFGRRVLCYPLYRHYGMVSAAVRDTAVILQKGKACVLKCLLDIHKVFRQNDPAYILNDLYITDYCIWIQRVKSKKVTALATMLQNTSLQKKDLQLELDELEHAAAMVAEEEEEQEASENDPTSCSESSSTSSDSSSDSSDEECEAEGQHCSDSSKGGGAGGETSKDSPSQPEPTSTGFPIPQEPMSTLLSAERKVDTVLSASGGSRQLIQELGKQVTEQLKISPDSQIPDSSHPSMSAVKTELTSESSSSSSSSSRTLLTLSPRRNPLLIVKTQEDLDDTDFIS